MSMRKKLVCLVVLAVAVCADDRSELIAKLDCQLNALAADVFEMRMTLNELKRQSPDKGVRCNNTQGGSGVTCLIEEDGRVSTEEDEESGQEHGGNSTKGRDESSQGERTYYLMEAREVRGELTPQGRRLILQFWTDCPDDKINSNWMIMPPGTSTDYEELAGGIKNLAEPGLREAYLDLDRPEPEVHISISIPMTRIYFVLNAEFEEALNVTDLPELFIRPFTDIVYTRGELATFEFSTRNERGQSTARGTLLNLNTNQMQISKTDRLEVSRPERSSSDIKKREVIVSTDEEAFSGVVSVHGGWYTYGTMIRRVTITDERVLRPLDQQGPYPEGFLHPHVIMYGTRGDEDNVTMCSIKGSCVFSCSILGEDIRNVTATEVISPGQQVPINYSSDGASEGWYYKSVYFFLDLDHYGVGERQFLCEGMNAEGNVAGRLADLYVYQLAEVVLDETRIEVVNDSKVILYCAVQGSPEPDFSFYVSMPGDDGFGTFLDPEKVDRVDGGTVVSFVTLDGMPDKAECGYRQFKTDSTYSSYDMLGSGE